MKKNYAIGKILMWVGVVASCISIVTDAECGRRRALAIEIGGKTGPIENIEAIEKVRIIGERTVFLEKILNLDDTGRYASKGGAALKAEATNLAGEMYFAFRDGISEKKSMTDTDVVVPVSELAIGRVLLSQIMQELQRVPNSASVDNESGTAGVTLDSTYGDFIAALNGAGGLLNGVAAGAGQLNAFNDCILDQWDGVAPIHHATAAAFALRGMADSGHAGANNLKWHFLRSVISVAEDGGLGVRLGAGVGVGLTWRTVRAIAKLWGSL